ncbi:MAG TPA: cytochrome c maturation protein CcmE [Anaerolineaceae bacterium]|nr:cytochrome c maturation protein CcmE [Anaerolineaceae bacterium]HPS32454.1 cytochrome c maturation protein CcmE [Anaerolineaceae bacterium]
MKNKKNIKLIIGIALIAAALLYLVISSTLSQSQYFMTVAEIKDGQAELVGKNIRMSGVVLGDTISYDPQTLDLSFEVAQIPGDHQLIKDMGGMSVVLAQAAHDPTLPKIQVHYKGPRPDLLKDEAQAIMTGALDESGVFQVSELLLKCPSKYEAELPAQSK